MNFLKNVLFEDISKFHYFMSAKQIANYQKTKVMLALIPLLFLIPMYFYQDFSKAPLLLISMVLLYKLPYFLYNSAHKQNHNDIVCAIPLWINMLYALIETNNIHNAIKNSLDTDIPFCIKNELKDFVQKIDIDPTNKQAYLGFLKRYNVEGFSEIMLKLYEFRNLSKEKLKYEIKELNVTLGCIESEKRKLQYKNELSTTDICTGALLFVPSIYIILICMLPSLFSM